MIPGNRPEDLLWESCWEDAFDRLHNGRTCTGIDCPACSADVDRLAEALFDERYDPYEDSRFDTEWERDEYFNDH
jgi:hypothetical protein